MINFFWFFSCLRYFHNNFSIFKMADITLRILSLRTQTLRPNKLNPDFVWRLRPLIRNMQGHDSVCICVCIHICAENIVINLYLSCYLTNNTYWITQYFSVLLLSPRRLVCCWTRTESFKQKKSWTLAVYKYWSDWFSPVADFHSKSQ